MKSIRTSLFSALLVARLTFLVGCVSDAPFKIETSYVPQQLNDGWQIASPEDVNISQQALDNIYSALISEDQYFNATSLLIVKNAALVFEAYCRSPEDRDRFNNIQSAAKSITSLVLGIVKSEDYFESIDETLYSIIPDKFPSDTLKKSITLHHLLTMSSGLSFDNDAFSVEIHSDEPSDPIQYILLKPLYAAPGEKFYYRDCDPHLISYAIQRMTGRTEEQFAKERLFDPLEITDYYWDSDHTGTTTGAYGLHLKPRDVAKIGQLVLDHGYWNGDQIVDSAWVDTSTRAHITTQHQTEPFVYDYGYYWWIVPRWNAVTAWGQGGNFIFIVPEKELVVIMTSIPDVDDDVVGTKLSDFEGLIRPLLEEE